MSKNNEYKKLQSWDPKSEVQRSVEKEFYSKTDDTMRHKKKSKKSGKPRSNHKHNYIDALIFGESYCGKYNYVGKVCSVCGFLKRSDWRKELRNRFDLKIEERENLPKYKKINENTARIIKQTEV